MRLIRKISLVILVLAMWSQLGFVGTPQTGKMDKNSSISQQTIQSVLEVSPRIAEAGAAKYCLWNRGSNVAQIDYYRNGKLKKTLIDPGENSELFIDMGSTFVLHVYKSSTEYSTVDNDPGQYEFQGSDDLWLDNAWAG